jgi:hypothetical protein
MVGPAIPGHSFFYSLLVSVRFAGLSAPGHADGIVTFVAFS